MESEIGKAILTNLPGGGLSAFLYYLYWNEKKIREKLTVDIIAIYKQIAESKSGDG